MSKSIELPDGARICIVLLTGLGDVIHGLPLVNALKREDPDRHITWVVEPVPAGVLEHHPAVDEIVVFEKKRGARGVAALAGDLRRRSFDITLNLNIYFKSIFPTAFSGAPVRVGFERGRARDGVWLAANRHLPRRPRSHTQGMFLEFLELLGVESHPLHWRLGPTAAEREEQRRYFERFDGPVAAVVPASANPKKDWVPERYGPVLEALETDYGFDTMIVGGPSARERELTDRMLAATRARPEIALVDGVRRLLWLLEGSSLVIAPDTGPVHMARAMEVPVIGLYGHTNPWRVGPYRRYEDLWVDTYTDPGAEPDPSNATPKLDRMERITAGQVMERVERAVRDHIGGAGQP